MVAFDGKHVVAAAFGQFLDVAAVHMQRVRGEHHAGQVGRALVTGVGAGERVEQRQDLGDLGGVDRDVTLADDDAFPVDERGEQADLAGRGVQLRPGAF